MITLLQNSILYNNVYVVVSFIVYFIRDYLQLKRKVPLIVFFKCLFKGYYLSCYYLYNLENNDWKLYISDIKLKKMRFLYKRNVYNDFVQNKLLFYMFAKVPAILFLIMEGELHAIEQISDKGENSALLYEMLKEKQKIIAKPFNAGKGDGVYMLSYNEGNVFLNEKMIAYNDLLLWFKNKTNYIITEYAEQAEYASNIFPNTANTIRFMTLIDPETLEPFIISAYHKFGTNLSFPVDNGDRGGLYSLIELKSGRIVHAKNVRMRYVMNDENNISIHPDTGASILNLEVPNWDKICQKVLSVAKRFSFLPIVGWDIVVSDDDIIVLEGNNMASFQMYQMFSPILINERLVNCLKYYKLI